MKNWPVKSFEACAGRAAVLVYSVLLFAAAVARPLAGAPVPPAFFSDAQVEEVVGKENEAEVRRLAEAQMGQERLDELIAELSPAVMPTSETLGLLLDSRGLRAKLQGELQRIAEAGEVFELGSTVDVNLMGVSHQMVVRSRDGLRPRREPVRIELVNVDAQKLDGYESVRLLMEGRSWTPILLDVQFLYPEIGVGRLSGANLWPTHPYHGGDIVVSESDPKARLSIIGFEDIMNRIYYSFLPLSSAGEKGGDWDRIVGLRLRKRPPFSYHPIEIPGTTPSTSGPRREQPEHGRSSGPVDAPPAQIPALPAEAP